MKILKYSAIAAVFFVAGWLLGQSYALPLLPKITNPQNQTENKVSAKTVTYLINFGEARFGAATNFNEAASLSAGVMEFQDVVFTPGETVLDVLKRLANQNNLDLGIKEYEGLGSLVEKVGDKQNGQNNNYWYYKVNDVQPQIGASQYQLQAGERVEWRFEPLQTQE